MAKELWTWTKAEQRGASLNTSELFPVHRERPPKVEAEVTRSDLTRQDKTAEPKRSCKALAGGGRRGRLLQFSRLETRGLSAGGCRHAAEEKTRAV